MLSSRPTRHRYGGEVIPLDFSRTVVTELAPDGLIPQMVEMPTTGPVGGLNYRFEPWKLGDGQVYVIVRAVDERADLAKSAEALEEWVRHRWGADALVIEDWGYDGPRYRQRTSGGERESVDATAMTRRGLVLEGVLS